MRLRQRFIAVFTAAVTSVSMIVSPLSVMAAEDTDTSAVVVEEAELPCGLSGMPDGFMVTEDDIHDKEEAAAAGMLEDLSGMVPGKDYIDKQIVYTAHDREYAEQVAKAYNAELLSFAYGVAVARITDENISVADAVAAGLDTSLNLPIVSPNHMIPVEKPVISKGTSSRSDEVIIEGEDTVDLSAGWSDALGMLENPDPFLQPGTRFNQKDAWNPEKEGEDTNAYQWMHDMVGTYEAWWTTMGSNNVTVAVIDSGVDTDHEDLTSSDGRSVWNVTDVYVNPTVEGKETYLIDNDGHGTHVAGIIGATADNGKGGAGIAPLVNILGVAIQTYYGPTESENASSSYTDDNIARAINYVAGDNDKGEVQAQIINMSLGGTGYNQAVADAVQNAYDKDITVIASMGNPDTNAVFYPAAYEHVIAVSAVDQAGNKTFFSSYGDWADIAAPGIDIVSTWNGHANDYDSNEPRGHVTEDQNNWYASWPGTSMAAPVVAGACALYMSMAGNVKPDDMESILKSTATKISDKSLGAGIVNVAAMIGEDVKPAATVLTRSETKDGKYTEVKDGDSLNSTDYIKLSAPEGDRALFFSYTVNGKKPAFKDDAVAPGCCYADENAIPVSDLVKNGAPEGKSFTFKSVYMNPHGVIGKVTPVNITISKDPTTPTVKVYGSEFIARGKSITYTATTDPAGSITQGIKWSLGEGTAPGISINEKTGKVTVKKTVEINTRFSVIATLGYPAVTGQKEVTVKDPLTGITIDKDKTVPKSYDPKYNNNGSLNSVTLYTVDVPGTDNNESRIYLPINLTRPECYESTENSTVMEPVSSRPGVAYAEWDDKENSWFIQSGRVAGTTKITWSTDDGSGKKATVTVKTIVPVSSVTVKTKNYQEFVAYGKSIQFVGVAGSSYGKPSVPKLSWDYEVTAVYTDPDTEKNTKIDATNDWKAQGLAKITQSGKLTVNNKAADYIADEKYEKWDSQIQIKATAKATDGSGEYGYNTVIATNPTKEVRWRLIQKDTDGNIPEGGDSGWSSKSGTKEIDLYLEDSDKNLTNYLYIDTNGSGYIKSEMCIASSNKPRIAALKEPDRVVLDDAGQEVKEGDNTVTCLKYELNPGLTTEFKVGRTEIVKFSFIANDGSGKKNTVTLKIHAK